MRTALEEAGRLVERQFTVLILCRDRAIVRSLEYQEERLIEIIRHAIGEHEIGIHRMTLIAHCIGVRGVEVIHLMLLVNDTRFEALHAPAVIELAKVPVVAGAHDFEIVTLANFFDGRSADRKLWAEFIDEGSHLII